MLGCGIVGVEQAEVLRDKSIIEERLKKEQGRCETLLDMRMNNETPKEVFSRKLQEVEKKIAELEAWIFICVFISFTSVGRHFPKNMALQLEKPSRYEMLADVTVDQQATGLPSAVPSFPVCRSIRQVSV